MMLQDEARFGLLGDVRPCWAPPGMRPVARARVVREYTYAFAAVSPEDGAMVSLVLPRACAETMSIFLDEVSRRFPDEIVLMILDGAGWHISRDLDIPPNVVLEPLPPYSPELNPVEHLWEELREKWFGNEVFESLDAVEDRLVEALRELEASPGRVASMTGFPWLLSCAMNAN
jgi:transposase